MVGAAPAMAHPTAKTTKLTQNVHFALYRAYKSPLDGWLSLVRSTLVFERYLPRLETYQKKHVPQEDIMNATPSHASLLRD